jgi:3-hydroxyisobutyrate dehydrogenase-like beta-hydroxyacid dehydrogenase
MNAMAARYRLGVLGLGEAGLAVATGVHWEGGVAVAGFDVRRDDPELRERARDLALVGSARELAESSDVLLVLTSGSSAVTVATELAPWLRPGQVYADWNSASPQTMREVAAVVQPTGALFADGAVMAAVPPHGHRVPVLLSGPGAGAMAERTAGFGLRLEVIGDQPGQAAAVKMLRSLLVKGIEALVIECLLGAEHYGVRDRVLASMAGTPDTSDWEALAGYAVGRVSAHGARRAAELYEVAETLAAADVEPWLATAAARRLDTFVARPGDGGGDTP